ncbi:OmpA family protein [Neisseria iguanae]|uniref:OmpA family protein n=1 Tax=Neisseria iguanae TaxID=90242 RepID=A0A2P7U1I2_9NEIS|nr:OmpA family protein [Neisseria iguanae]PSJ80763.1 OmpA family protein [Neisseria iguanae]
MSDNDEHKEQRLGLWIAGGAAALATVVILLLSVWGWETGKIEGSSHYRRQTEVTAYDHSAAAHNASHNLAGDAAAVFVENGIVKFYFATGKSELAAGAEEALKDVLAGVKDGRKAVVSGFHDSTGNQAFNEQLSKDRALTVKNALMGFGVAEEQIELRKPADTEGGNNPEARRVEVVLE